MKFIHGLRPFVLALALAGGIPAVAGSNSSSDDAAAEESAPSVAARARQLAADVREFAREPGLSRSKREKHIATAVRVAVVGATAYRESPEAVLGAAADLAAAAAAAAPAYAEVIAKAAALAPAVARIDGATGQIRSAALAATKPGAKVRRPARSVARAEASDEPPVRRRRPRAADADAEDQPAPRMAEEDSGEPPVRPSRRSRAVRLAADDTDDTEIARERPNRAGTSANLDQNSGFNVTADVSAKHDDNVFLSSTTKVRDTIYSVAPGVGFRWGQDTLANGTLGYKESFNRYANKSAPNVSLGEATGQFGYSDDATTVGLGASYSQLYQANTDALGTGTGTLVRSNIFGANGSFETLIGGKTSVQVGGNYTDTKYPTGGLFGNRMVAAPLNFFYKVTPKVDLSAGYTYSTQRPEGSTIRSKDQYFNLGARGNFTPKLSGTFSAGEQTRRAGDSPQQRVFSFNSAFDYELTAKTGATLSATRNFNVSSLGATTTNSTYQLGLNTEFTPQWKAGASVGFLANDYGAAVFQLGTTAPAQRTDHTWQGGINTSYSFTSWFSTSASYQMRKNQSTLTGVDFSDNIVNLTLGFRY